MPCCGHLRRIYPFADPQLLVLTKNLQPQRLTTTFVPGAPPTAPSLASRSAEASPSSNSHLSLKLLRPSVVLTVLRFATNINFYFFPTRLRPARVDSNARARLWHLFFIFYNFFTSQLARRSSKPVALLSSNSPKSNAKLLPTTESFSFHFLSSATALVLRMHHRASHPPSTAARPSPTH